MTYDGGTDEFGLTYFTLSFLFFLFFPPRKLNEKGIYNIIMIRIESKNI